MQERQNGEIRMELRELRECFEESSYISGSAAQALKKIAERLRQMNSLLNMSIFQQEHMEISKEEATWLNKELPEWSKEYDKDYTRR